MTYAERNVRGLSKVIVIAAIVVVALAAYTVWYSVQPPPQSKRSGIESGQLVTGHIHFLYIDNDNPSFMLLGTHEGLYRTKDGDKTWVAVEVKGEVRSRDFMAIASDSSKNPKVLYAAGHGMFVIKSTDNGETWALVDRGLPDGDVHAITVARNDPNTVYAWVVGYGLFGSKNGGESWQRMDDGPPNSNVLALASVNIPTGMGGIYLYAGTADGLFRSADCFCGWNKVAKFFDSKTIYALAVSPNDPRVILASTMDGVYRSDDAGATWEMITRGLGKDPIGALAFADARNVYAVDVAGVMFRSTDFGDSWVLIK